MKRSSTTLSRRTILASGAGAALSFASPGIVRSWAQQGPVRIGVSTPMSGSQQLYGQPIMMAAEQAAERVNAAGGIDGRPVVLVKMDDKGDPNQVIANAREMNGSGINLLVGGVLTSTALAVINIVPSLQSVFISMGVSDPRLTHEMFNRHHFQTAHNSYAWCRGNARVLAKKNPELKKWGGVVPDVAVGHYTFNQVSKAVKRFYKELANVDVEFMEPMLTKFDATDYKQQIAQLLAANVDCVYQGIFGSGGITFHQQARQLGLDRRAKAIFDTTSLDVQIGKAMGNNIPDNLWAATLGGFPGAYPNNAESQALLRHFQDKASDPIPVGLTILGHIAVTAMCEGVRKAKSTQTEEVIQALEGLQFNTVKGPAFFRKEDHQLVSDINLVRLGKAAGPSGWEVKELLTMSASEVINPPRPGQPLQDG